MEKLTTKGITGQKEKAMAPTIAAALGSFCEQNEEFRQAVEQGPEFQKCMAAVAAGVGSSISDLEAIKRAVEFYFKGARVAFEMRIEMDGDIPEAPKGVIVSLEDFL